MLNRLFDDETGAVLSAEIVLILTVGVLAMIVGLSEVAVAVNTELNDISNGVGAFRQSFGTTGYISISGGRLISFFDGSTFIDAIDDCDRNTSCDLVAAAPSAASIE